jgi:hypothetical protein
MTMETARAMTTAWQQAFEQVAQRYPGSVYNFGQAGPSIDVPVTEGRGLTFGVCSEMIGADVSILPEWEPTGVGGIDTDVSSECADADLIAYAILKAAREYTFELDREFDRTHPGYWDIYSDNATAACDDEGCQATHALPDWDAE